MTGQGVVGRALVALLALAGLAAVGLPPVHGGLGSGEALALGLGAGLVLYAVLARRRPRPHRRALALLPLLAGRSAVEELVWRGFVLGSLVRLLGPIGALAISSGGFALAHRRRALHLATGTTFGAVYLASGRLGAACAAHALYNTLVALGTRPLPATLPATGLPAAELRGVWKRYGGTEALRGVDLELGEGEIVALLGPNGAGKSTAVSILLGLRRPDRGEALLGGLDPRLPQARRSIGCVPQEIGFPASLRVGELIDLVRAHHETPRPRRELLDRFGLAELARRQAGGLSGGQKRRLAVALAFAGAPRALFLDEPSAGLDVESRHALWDEVRAHARAGGSALLTTHYLEEAEALASEVVVLDAGRVVARGTTGELRTALGLATVRLQARDLPPLRAAAQLEQTPAGTAILTSDPAALVRELVAAGVDLAGLEVAPPPLEQVLLGPREEQA